MYVNKFCATLYRTVPISPSSVNYDLIYRSSTWFCYGSRETNLHIRRSFLTNQHHCRIPEQWNSTHSRSFPLSIIENCCTPDSILDRCWFDVRIPWCCIASFYDFSSPIDRVLNFLSITGNNLPFIDQGKWNTSRYAFCTNFYPGCYQIS